MKRIFFDNCIYIYRSGNHYCICRQRERVILPSQICLSPHDLADRFLQKIERSPGVFIDGTCGRAIFSLMDAWRHRPLSADSGPPNRIFVVPPQKHIQADDQKFANACQKLWGLPASCGGPFLVDRETAGQFAVFADLPQCLDVHPAVAGGLRFLKLNESALPRVLRVIGDPRWHTDPRRPDSLRPLIGHLGLSQTKFSDLDPLHRQRFSLVVSAWYRPKIAKRVSVRRHRGAFKFLSGECHWRDFSRHLKHGQFRALRRGSLSFVKFLQRCWLQGLYGKRSGDNFIDPTFFRDESDRFRFRDFLEAAQ